MATTTATLTAREYLRVSQDGSGRERSNEEQARDNARFVERHPQLVWAGLPAYSDVGSASKYARKARGDYDRLMSDLRDGSFGADVLVVWINSRGTRRPEEILDLLNECVRHDVRIAVTEHDRIYDPNNAHDWGTLIKEAVDDALYSAKISGAVRRAMRANAEAGLSNGGRRSFGYAKDGKSLDPVEADAVREAVRRVLGGDSVRAIAKDFNARGIRTAAGNAWHPGPLANVIGGTRIAGIRTHHGEVMDKCQWPAIIDRDTHRRVTAVLASRTPVGRRGRTPWLLHGLLRCELCGAALVSQQDARGTKWYICRKAPGYKGCGHNSIKAEPTEVLLGVLVEDRLADVAARRAAGGMDEDVDDAAELAELNRIEAARVEAAEDRGANAVNPDVGIDRATFNALTNALNAQQRAVEARLASKVRSATPLDFVLADGEIGRTWDELNRDERRKRLDALVDHVTVAPASVKGSRRYEADRVKAPGRIAWKA